MHLGEHDSVEEAYRAGRCRLDATSAKITALNAPALLAGKVSLSLSQRPKPATSNMTKEEFLGAVQQTKEHIQVCGVCVVEGSAGGGGAACFSRPEGHCK